MKTGRPELDAIFRVTNIPEDEPVFILRARDPNARAGVWGWVQASRRAGVPASVLEQAVRQGEAMLAWQTKKPADDLHLDERQRKELTAAFHRRMYDQGRGLSPLHKFNALDPAPEPSPDLLRAVALESRELARLFHCRADDYVRAFTAIGQETIEARRHTEQALKARGHARYLTTWAMTLEAAAFALEREPVPVPFALGFGEPHAGA